MSLDDKFYLARAPHDPGPDNRALTHGGALACHHKGENSIQAAPNFNFSQLLPLGARTRGSSRGGMPIHLR